MLSAGYTPTCLYNFNFQGNEIKANSKGWSWKTNKVGMNRLIKADRLIMAGNLPYLVAYMTKMPINVNRSRRFSNRPHLWQWNYCLSSRTMGKKMDNY